MRNRTLRGAIAAIAAAATNGRIAFQAFDDGFPRVFTIEPDGSGLRQVTHVPAKDPRHRPRRREPELVARRKHDRVRHR